jgi:hypothetical protein
MNGIDARDYHMPENVHEFVRCYAPAARRDFHVFMCAVQIMSKSGLEIKCPVKAAAVAQELHYLHDEFNLAVSKLATQHKYRKRGSVTENEIPTDAIVRILRVSFFKVIQKDASLATKQDTGWYSGHPFDWKTAITDAMPAPPTWLSGSAIAAAFASLMGHTDHDAVSGFSTKPVNFDDYEEAEDDEDEDSDDQWNTDWTGD